MTAEMLRGAATAALSFAAVIAVFGLIGSVVDARLLLRSVPRPLGAISMAMVVALGVFTTFAAMARRVAHARVLRGEPSRLRTLVPLLEQSIERAEMMGISMASRGWGVQHAEAPGQNATVTMTAVTVRVGERVLLENVNLELRSATVTVLTGATGSGKTTLLHLIRGYFAQRSGEERAVVADGRIEVFGAPPRLAHPIGLTSQQPELTFVAPTVWEELAFGAMQNGHDVEAAVAHAAAQTGIAHLLERRVEQLSAGEQAVVAIAAACTAQPGILLLDEPIADLDEVATEYVVCVLRELREAGVTILIAEHRAAALASVADQWLRIESSNITEGRPVFGTPEAAGVAVERAARAPEQSADALGSVTVLQGPNGSGKTTLLTKLAIQGRRAVASVAMVPHRVDDLFFAETVDEECKRADARNKAQEHSLPLTRDRLLRFLPTFTSFDANPRDCSAGTRVVLAICLQLALGRGRLVLDEPTRGLDAEARAELVRVLRELADQGIHVLVATHDEEFATAVGGARVEMRDGELIGARVDDGWIRLHAGVMQS